MKLSNYLVYFLNKSTFFDNDFVLKKKCQGGLIVGARVGDLVMPLTLKMIAVKRHGYKLYM